VQFTKLYDMCSCYQRDCGAHEKYRRITFNLARFMQKRTLAIILGLVLPLSLAFAKPYPDVPTDSEYTESIYVLQRLGIMTGNDDGTFGYGTTLNRASLLTLAYRAAKKPIRAIHYDGSFRDVSDGQWYTNVIYTAKRDGVIQGYPDSTARPAQEVTLVEALKIILNSLSIPLPVLTQEDRLSVGGFVGTTTGAWYLPWLSAGFILDLLPKELLKYNELNPNLPLRRELAAEILYRTMNADLSLLADREIIENSDGDPSNLSSPAANPEPFGAELTSVPIHKTGKTGARGAVSLAFDLEASSTILVEARNLSSQSAGVKCFLYPLDESGFTSVFFIGFEEGGGCFIRARIGSGRFQVEIRSPSEGADYSLDVVETQGDGNDGPVESSLLPISSPRSGSLTSGDYEDWFRFTVPTKEPHRVQLDSKADLSCMLFPAQNVDLSSFSVPKCGDSASYDPGTWYISVRKKADGAGTQSYTVELR
jgi:hypothetical protein